jgi:hypothetical protein
MLNNVDHGISLNGRFPKCSIGDFVDRRAEPREKPNKVIASAGRDS